jgi:hypothetical protein
LHVHRINVQLFLSIDLAVFIWVYKKKWANSDRIWVNYFRTQHHRPISYVRRMIKNTLTGRTHPSANHLTEKGSFTIGSRSSGQDWSWAVATKTWRRDTEGWQASPGTGRTWLGNSPGCPAGSRTTRMTPPFSRNQLRMPVRIRAWGSPGGCGGQTKSSTGPCYPMSLEKNKRGIRI